MIRCTSEWNWISVKEQTCVSYQTVADFSLSNLFRVLINVMNVLRDHWIFCCIDQAVFTFSYITFLTRMGERMADDLRHQLFASFLKQDISFYDRHKTGELVNRLVIIHCLVHYWCMHHHQLFFLWRSYAFFCMTVMTSNYASHLTDWQLMCKISKAHSRCVYLRECAVLLR